LFCYRVCHSGEIKIFKSIYAAWARSVEHKSVVVRDNCSTSAGRNEQTMMMKKKKKKTVVKAWDRREKPTEPASSGAGRAWDSARDSASCRRVISASSAELTNERRTYRQRPRRPTPADHCLAVGRWKRLTDICPHFGHLPPPPYLNNQSINQSINHLSLSTGLSKIQWNIYAYSNYPRKTTRTIELTAAEKNGNKKPPPSRTHRVQLTAVPSP